MTRPLVLIHGFTGSPASWEQVRAALPSDVPVLAPALVGHDGTAGSPGVRTFDDELDRLARVVRDAGFEGARVAGYSLGGRVALGLLVRHPGLFSGATIIGANPGMTHPGDQEKRAAEEEEWARLLEREGVPTFVATWEALPLWGTQDALDPAAVARQRRIRLSHDPAGLARALRALGLAAMPDYRPRLGDVAVPVDLVVGEHDAKFRALAAEMDRLIPRSRVLVVAGAGHNVVLERPAEVARLIQELDG